MSCLRCGNTDPYVVAPDGLCCGGRGCDGPAATLGAAVERILPGEDAPPWLNRADVSEARPCWQCASTEHTLGECPSLPELYRCEQPSAQSPAQGDEAERIAVAKALRCSCERCAFDAWSECIYATAAIRALDEVRGRARFHGGQYRADWNAAIERVIAERDALRDEASDLRAQREELREEVERLRADMERLKGALETIHSVTVGHPDGRLCALSGCKVCSAWSIAARALGKGDDRG